ncbi:MAG: hypothetical protein IT449_12870 [Phycisphaerales bacterium]|nr:hypothetical protein [Phycisphaerales bacterium]
MPPRAELAAVDDNCVVCDVAAYDGDRLLACGKQVQAVLKAEAIRWIIERG